MTTPNLSSLKIINGRLVAPDEQIEECARVICGHDCVRARLCEEPCVGGDGRNAPCRATRDQLILTGLWQTARDVMAARDKQLGIVTVPVVNAPVKEKTK